MISKKGLANANKLITRILWKAAHDFNLRINYLEAGNLRNAIAREGYAIVAIPEAKANDFEAFVEKIES